MEIPRIYQDIDQYLSPNKALLLFGPRQAGKTTLIENYLKTTKFRYRLDTGDNLLLREQLGNASLEKVIEYAQGYELIVIDEAQKIPNIGESLKMIIDHMKDIRIIATGSSSFELAGQTGEPLTGRKRTLTLYPIAQLELNKIHNQFDLKTQLENYLIYGSYPEIVTCTNINDKRDNLSELAHSYLLKDILEYDKIKNSNILLNLLRLLAFQISNEVSLHEIGKQLGIDHKSVGRYIDLLEKCFVIYPLSGFSRNLRKEISKKKKYYFYDVGIRNAIIANFNALPMRDDIGALWENFLVIERIKKQSYQPIYSNNYFWRTWDKKEIDFIEERNGKLFAYEFKWNNKTQKAPKDWISTYPESSFTIINKENYLDFILLNKNDQK